MLEEEQAETLAKVARAMFLSPREQQEVRKAAQVQETIVKIAYVLGRPANAIQKEMDDFAASVPFPYMEMVPIALKNVMAGLPLNRIPAYKRMEIETGMKGMNFGNGYATWEEMIPFEW